MKPLLKLTVVVITVSGILGCVSQSKYQAKEKEVQDLLAQLQAAHNKHGEQTEKERKLISESSALDQRTQELEEINQTLLQKNSDLTQQSIKLQDENLILKKQIQSKEEDAQKKQTELDQKISRMQETYEGLVKDLRGEIEHGNITVTKLRGQVTLNMVSQILFPSGSAELQPSGQKVLNSVASALKRIADKDIQIQGHTDDRKITVDAVKAKFPSNWELSSARALTVLKYLESKGAPSARLSLAGYGPYRPVESNKTEQGRQKNRRIEVVLVPRMTTDKDSD